MKKIITILMFIVLLSSVYAAPSNPGHPADQVEAGNFQNEKYTFPSDLDVGVDLGVANSITGANYVSSGGNLGYVGTLNKLDVANVFTSRVRSKDFRFGYDGSLDANPALALVGIANPVNKNDEGRALVDSYGGATPALWLNYGSVAGDWPYTFIGGEIRTYGQLGVKKIPTQALDVAGNILASGDITGNQLCVGGVCKSAWPAEIPTCADGQIAKWSAGAWICGTDGVGSGVVGWVDDGATVRLETGTDSVVIGSGTGLAKLHVKGGDIALDQDYSIGLDPVVDKFTYDGEDVGHYSLGWYSDSWDGGGRTAWMSGYSGMKFFSLGQPRMVITKNGNIGIGTTTPAAMLDIRGGVKVGEFKINPQDLTAYGSLMSVEGIATTGNISAVSNSVAFSGGGSIKADKNVIALEGGQFGSVTSESTISGNTVIAQKVVVNELEANDGLTINTPEIYMQATNGDNCKIELNSSRCGDPASTCNSPPIGLGSLDIVCYGPTDVCGNTIIESTIGETCDPPGNTISYNSSDPLECFGYTNFAYSEYTCSDSCINEGTSPVTCYCSVRCTYKDPFCQVRKYYDCAGGSVASTAACDSGGCFIP